VNHESLLLCARQVVSLVYEAVPVYLAVAATVLGTERRLMSCLIYYVASWFVCSSWHDFLGFHTAVYCLVNSTNDWSAPSACSTQSCCGVRLVHWL